MLVQEPQKFARIESVESRVDCLSIVNFGDALSSLGGQLEFDVAMSESSRTADSLTVNYVFTIGRPAFGRGCKVTGEAVVRFAGANPDGNFDTVDSDEMAVEIFRKNYETVYLMHMALGMPTPSPWITEDVSVASRNKELVEPKLK